MTLNTTNTSITLSHWNACGVQNKREELISYLNSHNTDIICISKTRLGNRNFTIPNYNIVKQQRQLSATNCGGVAILAKKSIKFIPIYTNTTSIETIGIKLQDNLTIYAIYIHPNARVDWNELKNLITEKTITTGDLNARHTLWNNSQNNQIGKQLYKFTCDNGIILEWPSKPTHYPANGNSPSTIDLTLIKNVTNYTKPTISSELSSDHAPVELHINCNITTAKTIYDFKSANWNIYKNHINNNLTIIKPQTENEIENTIKSLTQIIKQARDKAIPTKTITSKKHSPPAKIQDLIKQRNKIRKAYQRTRDSMLLIIKYNINEEIKEALSEHQNDRWNSVLKQKFNNNSRWRLLKALRRKNKNKIQTLTHKTKTLANDAEIAEAFAENFQTNLNIDHKITTSTKDLPVKNTMDRISRYKTETNAEILISPKDIASHIKTLGSFKVPGPDGITNILLKYIPKKALIQITYIINQAILLNYFPKVWRTATLIPIPKPNKDTGAIENYRPISLLDGLSKIYEKIITTKLTDHLEENRIINHNQFGFRPNHSTTLQLFRVINNITMNLNIKHTTSMLLLDLQKAFDYVWQEGLLHKLDTIKTPKYIIKILKHYLQDRT